MSKQSAISGNPRVAAKQRARRPLPDTTLDAPLARRLSRQLGVAVTSPADLLRLATGRHLTLDVVHALRAHGLLASEIYRIVIPQRTLTHRRATGQKHLSADEADRAVRLARIAALAEHAFGERDRALHWLRKPKRFLEGRTPIDVLTSSEGTRLIEEKLLQLEHGLVA
jgi:putative toxin-antitoxin system antitoxin component (TIGR02293 family)